jgi:hypothetical protein
VQGSSPVPSRFRERLAKQIEIFLKELGSGQFAEECSATQMVQAVAFPLAVAVVGQRRGWVSDELAEKCAMDVFAVLFRGRTRDSRGLLRTVADRYTKAGNRRAFTEIVGDGALWTALVATLGSSRWSGSGSYVDKAIAIRQVFHSTELLATAKGHRIASLVAKTSIEDARRYITEVAPAAEELLRRIETALRPIWEEVVRGQVARHITHRVGDLLWRDGSGWATSLSEITVDVGHQRLSVRLRGFEMVVGATFYVNVDDSASRSLQLRVLMADLQRLMAVAVPDA